jgi:hypothetical protein
VVTSEYIQGKHATNNRAHERLAALGAGPGNSLIGKVLGFLKRH